MSIKTSIASLSKEQTSIIKGLGILLILFHNFFHWIDPIDSIENEFYFKTEHFQAFLQAFVDTPGEFVNILFSYLGHFGVQLFIFISGYGLTRSFLKKEKPWGRFMLDRLKKLYPLILIGLLIFFLSKIVMSYALPTHVELRSMMLKLVFAQTFVPGETMSINGPWWFFSLILELYIFFPLLYKAIKKYDFKAFAAITIASYIIVIPVLNSWHPQGGITIMQHCIAHFPEFCLGIYLGRKEQLSVNTWAFLLALTVFILGNFFKGFFPFTHLSITYIFIYIIAKTISWQPRLNVSRRVLVFIGDISMVLFVTHGIFRWQFVCLAKTANSPVMTVVYALLFLLYAIIISLAAKAIYDWTQRLLNKTKPER